MPPHVLADLAVVLAAGGGMRIGGPKGLLDLQGAPLVRHHVAALAPWCARVVVAVGARADDHRAILGDVVLVENPHWAVEWPVQSLARALRAAEPRGPALVTPVDTPPASRAVIAALLEGAGAAVPRGPDGRDGHPVRIDPPEIATILAGPPEGGLRAVLASARRVPVAAAVGADFDTPEAWARFAADYRSERT